MQNCNIKGFGFDNCELQCEQLNVVLFNIELNIGVFSGTLSFGAKQHSGKMPIFYFYQFMDLYGAHMIHVRTYGCSISFCTLTLHRSHIDKSLVAEPPFYCIFVISE